MCASEIRRMRASRIAGNPLSREQQSFLQPLLFGKSARGREFSLHRDSIRSDHLERVIGLLHPSVEDAPISVCLAPGCQARGQAALCLRRGCTGAIGFHPETCTGDLIHALSRGLSVLKSKTGNCLGGNSLLEVLFNSIWATREAGAGRR